VAMNEYFYIEKNKKSCERAPDNDSGLQTERDLK
jgi:hypothetical protein